jgi:hypothetical protein
MPTTYRPCHFCSRISELFTDPPLCERHIELAMVRSNLERAGTAFTAQTAAQELLRITRDGHSVVTRPHEVLELIGQMH